MVRKSDILLIGDSAGASLLFYTLKILIGKNYNMNKGNAGGVDIKNLEINAMVIKDDLRFQQIVLMSPWFDLLCNTKSWRENSSVIQTFDLIQPLNKVRKLAKWAFGTTPK